MGRLALPTEIVDSIRFKYAPQPTISEEEAAIVTLAGRTAAVVEDLAAELELLWGSILAGDILLAGPLRRKEAELLLAETRAQLLTVLPPRAIELAEPDVQPERPYASGLEAWEPLLYRPAYEPRPLAQNLCLEPALAATLDQCGAL